jgi:hypothetical protein
VLVGRHFGEMQGASKASAQEQASRFDDAADRLASRRRLLNLPSTSSHTVGSVSERTIAAGKAEQPAASAQSHRPVNKSEMDAMMARLANASAAVGAALDKIEPAPSPSEPPLPAPTRRSLRNEITVGGSTPHKQPAAPQPGKQQPTYRNTAMSLQEAVAADAALPTPNATSPGYAAQTQEARDSCDATTISERVAKLNAKYDQIEGMVNHLSQLQFGAVDPRAVDSAVIEFFADANINVEVADLPSFAQLLEVVRLQAPSGYKPPSSDAIRSQLPPARQQHSSHGEFSA